MSSPAEPARILVAGIGNVFLGDDAFGVEVVRQLSSRTLPSGVRVADFGIRGYDLACALVDPYELIILVDASPRNSEPGSLYVIEPDLPQIFRQDPVVTNAHTMDPVSVLRLANTLGTVSSRIILVACEPETLGGDEGKMGLSEPVSKAAAEAVHVIEGLIAKALKSP
jgi:hydrogenase maturation protease